MCLFLREGGGGISEMVPIFRGNWSRSAECSANAWKHDSRAGVSFTQQHGNCISVIPLQRRVLCVLNSLAVVWACIFWVSQGDVPRGVDWKCTDFEFTGEAAGLKLTNYARRFEILLVYHSGVYLSLVEN